VNQLTIDFDAHEAGISAANACEKKARKVDPEFSEKAATAILAHLRTVGQASGEVLTDVAIAHGARAHDARAFGAVFSRLSRKGLIRTIGFCMRSKGHGTAGGRIWGLCL
jgi:hypothetical protein